MKKNAILVILAQSINYSIPLITFPILARRLGVSEFGILGFIFSLISYMCLFVDYGFNIGGTKIISEKIANKQVISEDFWAIWLAKMLIFILIFLILIITGNYIFSRLEYWLVIVSLLQVLGYVLNVNWYFQANGKIGVSTLILTFFKSLSIPLILFYVRDSSDIIEAVLLQSGVILLGAIFTILLLINDENIKKINTKSLKLIIYHLRDSCPYFLGALAISFYTGSSLILVRYFGTPEDIGLYNAADKIKMAFLGIFLILGTVFFPHVSKLYTSNILMAYNFVKKLLIAAIIVGSLITLTLYLLSDFFIEILLGSSYQKAAELLRILSPNLLLILLSVIFCNYILVPLGHKKLYYLIPAFTGFIYICLSIPLLTVYGVYGAAYASLISEFTGCLILVFFAFHYGYLRKIVKIY